MNVRVRAAVTSPSVVLFLAMFSSQAVLLVLSPILPAVAVDFDVSTAAAGQLRAVSGSVAGVFALGLGVFAANRSLRSLVTTGLLVLTVASALSAAAPNFGSLIVAQAIVGLGIAFLLSSAVAAAGEWVPHQRARVLSWALVGQPAAWIVGMPIVGAVGDVNWRYAWVAVPLVACVVSLAAISACPRTLTGGRSGIREPLVLREPEVRTWALGELLAYSAWAGVIVFVGAFFIETYRVSAGTAGVLLALSAVAYLPGNFLARRWIDRGARVILVGAVLASAAVVVLLGATRPGLWWSATMFALLAFFAGARTIAGSAAGMDSVAGGKVRAMSVRTAAVQFGYLFGAAVGGTALATAGYGGAGVAFGSLYLLAALPHIGPLVRARRAAAVGLRGAPPSRRGDRLLAERGTSCSF